ncbi:hypothetical protein VCR15J5_610393 [Vibrio crassostreae]|nr:hypothetical protein VCR15J5_610393 [Vibrio crassostreae]
MQFVALALALVESVLVQRERLKPGSFERQFVVLALALAESVLVQRERLNPEFFELQGEASA